MTPVTLRHKGSVEAVRAQRTALPVIGDIAVVRDGDSIVLATEPSRVIRLDGPEALDALDALDKGWWAGFLSYDLGRAVERVTPRADTHGSGPVIPDLVLAKFEQRRVVSLEAPFTLAPGIGPWRSSLDQRGWAAAVARIKEHLAAGDCYQVNLTRRLVADGERDPVSTFHTLLAGNPAPHAALVRLGDFAIVSASPERFLRRDGPSIETRPIKGTSSDRDVLAASEKDRAENVMIVDLARNDLGRICEYGSVHVPGLFDIEAHPGLFHLVSTVRGILRAETGFGEIIRATFPPASVTGCPKPRVMQIIEDLEPVRRGVYCGAVGFIDADKQVMDLNVAIRTFTMTGGMTYFGVGGGIVADSDADAEWEETELKASKLLGLVSG